jgi:DNA-binding response OmpR family regulator
MSTVLVVEDDPSISGLLERALSSNGYTVHVAGDGLLGLEKCSSVEPDVVVLDVNLPKLDGLAVAREMKAKEDLKHIPIVFLTAQDRPKDMIAGIQAGARHYLTKPFKLDDLLSKIKKLL